jgi:hypothetical protein
MTKFIYSLLLLVTLSLDVSAGGKKQKEPKVYTPAKMKAPLLSVSNTVALTYEVKVSSTPIDGTNIIESYTYTAHYSTNAWLDPQTGNVPVWYVHTTLDDVKSEQDKQQLWCAEADKPFDIDWREYVRTTYPRHRPAPLPPSGYYAGVQDDWRPPMRVSGGLDLNYNPYNHAPYWRNVTAVQSHYEVGAFGSTRGIGWGASYNAHYKSPVYVSR